ERSVQGFPWMVLANNGLRIYLVEEDISSPTPDPEPSPTSPHCTEHQHATVNEPLPSG
ncbi:hypothetical protein M9458_023493, partial [Cirrhinus mrigala]